MAGYLPAITPFAPMTARLAPLALALAACALALPAAAQPTLDPLQEPRYGTIRLDGSEAGVMDLTVSPETRNPETGREDCVGYLAPGAPDARVFWTGEGPLRFWMRSQVDGVMVVRAPSGEARCSDDADGVQPAVLWENPRPGRYTVWVGSFSRNLGDTPPEATLYAGSPPEAVALREPDASTESIVEMGPASGEPRSVTIGGPHPAAALGMPRECVGFFNAAPSIRYAVAEAPYYLLAESDDADLALAVRAPDGTWACNDDYVGSNPVVEVMGAGEHAVWVGTFRGYARNASPEATLAALTEAPERMEPPRPPAPPAPPPPPPPARSEPFSEGTYTPLDLEASGETLTLGEGDDRVTLSLVIESEISNPVEGMGCAGSIPVSPSATVTFEGDGPFSVTASDETDLVMVARTADGRWFCSDDASNRDPGIEFDGSQGRVQVWIGTFGGPDGADVELSAHRAPLAEAAPSAREVFDAFEDAVPVSYAEGDYDGDDLDPDADAPEAGFGATTVSAGGDVYNPVEGPSCAGFLSPAPSAVVRGGGTLAFQASSPGDDLTLLILTPDGRWFCSDDHAGLDPGIEVSGAGDGAYTVWVGTFGDGAPGEATLTVRQGSL